jgi:hypothetical protein
MSARLLDTALRADYRRNSYGIWQKLSLPVRARRAEIIFTPYVTMCRPSTRPGAGFVDPVLWKSRDRDPTSLRAEFDGPKGRAG